MRILLVQPSNAGTYERGRFAVLPEINLRLGYQITQSAMVTVGYDALSVSSVQRSGAAIDNGVNPSNTRYINITQPSDAVRPGFAFSGTDFWAHGLTAGLSLVY